MKDTIYNNIVLGGQYTIEEVIEAARKAGIYDEIMEMEKGFETVLYEDGTNISAGQRKSHCKSSGPGQKGGYGGRRHQ